MASDYEKILKDNIREYGEGTRHLAFLKRLYSDRTHFVFEIIQNAEDAKAKRIRFDLHGNRLEVRHDGRPFSGADVRGICGVGEGTKSEDLTQIGKFGIGFKSVYAYTTSPEIHSNGGPNGSEHFRIEHYVRPIGIEPRELGKPWTTLIILPIDAEDIDQQTAVRQIADRLQRLNVRTLLFLKHIEEVEYKLFDGTQGTYLRESRKTPSGQREVTVIGQCQISGEPHDYEEEWLLFQRPLQTPDSTDTVNVEIGFLVKQDQKSGKRQIVKVKASPLVVFFPTEKETNLGFLIQGPYRTTPARDNIPRDDDWNKRLVKTTGDLLCETLSRLKAQGLLSPTVLETLPINPDHFPEDSMFYPIFEKVKAAFRERELLPAHGGGYVSASRANLAGSRDLRDLLTPEQLTALLETGETLQWVSGEITRDRMPQLWQYLRDEMAIDLIDPDRFARLLKPDFLQQQNDEWFARFYAFLLGQEALWRAPRWPRVEPGILRRKAFLRLEDGSLVKPFDPEGRPNAYLPPEQPTKFVVVRRAIVKDEVAAEKALEFLKRLGLEEPDEVANVIENILPKYRGEGTDQIDDREYESDLQAILRALKTDSQEKKERLLREVYEIPLIKAENTLRGVTEYKRQDEVYHESQSLQIYFKDNDDAWFVAEDPAVLKSVATQLGVPDKVRIRFRKPSSSGYVAISDRHGWHMRGLNGFDPYTEVDGLEFAVTNPSVDRAKVIWNDILIPHKQLLRGTVEQATRQDYSNAKRRSEVSPAGALVINSQWIPCSDGGFCKPSDIRLEDLPDGFTRDEILAETLGIKRPLVENKLSKVAKSIGVDDPSDIQYLRDNYEDFRRWRKNREKKEEKQQAFPQQEVHNLDRRRQKIREQVIEAPLKQYYTKERRVRTSKNYGKQDIDIYLRDLYTNEDRIMLCQICKEEMPFKRRDGRYYFERVEAFDIPIEHEANYLALCPVCAAMYTEFIKNDPEAWDDLKRSFKGMDDLEINLRLGEVDTSIRFVESHRFDLRTVLEETDPSPSVP
ncbi:hypothetical protein D6779_01060 [Candidatus Parcubacteria bacterium]|nr:MAG: hypothetical protein D6779_01060 [Candidatus Parcubacteria bacterium]